MKEYYVLGTIKLKKILVRYETNTVDKLIFYSGVKYYQGSVGYSNY